MTSAVIGATGCVGSEIVRGLLASGYRLPRWFATPAEPAAPSAPRLLDSTGVLTTPGYPDLGGGDDGGNGPRDRRPCYAADWGRGPKAGPARGGEWLRCRGPIPAKPTRMQCPWQEVRCGAHGAT